MKVFYITVSLLLQCKQLFSSACSSATLLNRNADKKISYLQYPDTTRTYYTAYQSTFAIQTVAGMRQVLQKWMVMYPKPDSSWDKWKVIAAAVACRGEER